MLVPDASIECWPLNNDVDCHVSISERHLELHFLTHIFSLFPNSGSSSFHLYSFTHPIEKTPSTSKSWIFSKLFFFGEKVHRLIYYIVTLVRRWTWNMTQQLQRKKKVTQKKKRRKNNQHPLSLPEWLS